MNTSRLNRQLVSGLVACLAAAAAAWAQTAAPATAPPDVPPTPMPAFTPPARPLPGQINLRPSEPVVVERASVAAPTVITSDELQMSLDKKVATFTGHVKVVDPQGTMIADKMVVHIGDESSAGNSVSKIEATGGVVISQEGRRAIADEAVFTAADRVVILSGAAQVQTGNSLVTGETIIYDMTKNTAVVKGRPRMTIPQSQRGGSGGLFPTVPRLPTPAAAPSTPPASP